MREANRYLSLVASMQLLLLLLHEFLPCLRSLSTKRVQIYCYYGIRNQNHNKHGFVGLPNSIMVVVCGFLGQWVLLTSPQCCCEDPQPRLDPDAAVSPNSAVSPNCPDSGRDLGDWSPIVGDDPAAVTLLALSPDWSCC